MRFGGNDAACTCRVLPAKETITTAFTDPTKMSYSTRENLSNTSPKTVKSGYNPLCDKTLTGTGSTAQETLENITLNSRSGSVSTAKSSCSSCHGRLNSRSAGTEINVELYLAMEALKLNTKLCQREDPQFPTNGRSKKGLNSY